MTSFKQNLFFGSLGFGLSSLCVFATVAFAERQIYASLGLYGAYLFWTILFIGLGGVALSPLAKQTMTLKKFTGVFALAFFMYAAGWCVPYFMLKGIPGEWIGSLTGSILLGLVFVVSFRNLRSTPMVCILLFVTNSLGYFLGSSLNSKFGGSSGMLLWGASYGLFLGAGLGVSLYFVQTNKSRRVTQIG